MNTYQTLIAAAFAVIIFSACTSHDGRGTQSTQAPLVSFNLIDSIRDLYLRKQIPKDSIEIQEVRRNDCGEIHVEHVVYIDYRVSQNIGYLQNVEKSTLDYAGQIRELNSDSDAHLLNPFVELNDIYGQVFSFHGRLMFPGGMDDGIVPAVISDSMVYYMGQMMFCYPYLTAHKEAGGSIVYVFHQDPEHPWRLEIKRMGGTNGLQIWKRIEDASVYYQLYVPLRRALDLPQLVYLNNVGLAPCGMDSLVTSFDRINYDSLWAKY